MSPPALTSAYLAQQAVQATSTSITADAGPGWRELTQGRTKGIESGSCPHESDTDEDDEGVDLIEERFLDPMSDEGIAVKVAAYAASLSTFAQHYVVELPRRVLARATSFSETYENGVLTIQALNSEDVIAVGAHRLTPELQSAYAASRARRRQSGPSPPSLSSLRLDDAPASPPGESSSPVPNRHLHPPSSTTGGDSSSTPALPRDSDLSVSSAVLHTHTLPLSAPPPPSARRRRSPSPPFHPIPLAIASPPPFADLPGVDLAPSSDTDPARDELVHLYHFTAAGEHRDSTALGRLLEGVAEVARIRRVAAAPAPAARNTSAPSEEGLEFMFEVEQEEEEVEEEVEEVLRSSERNARRREHAGR
ncbi:hypothetical protein JCM11641_006889 [Rhodosporidiobolus odoratus]